MPLAMKTVTSRWLCLSVATRLLSADCCNGWPAIRYPTSQILFILSIAPVLERLNDLNHRYASCRSRDGKLHLSQPSPKLAELAGRAVLRLVT